MKTMCRINCSAPSSQTVIASCSMAERWLVDENVYDSVLVVLSWLGLKTRRRLSEYQERVKITKPNRASHHLYLESSCATPSPRLLLLYRESSGAITEPLPPWSVMQCNHIYTRSAISNAPALPCSLNDSKDIVHRTLCSKPWNVRKPYREGE